MLEVDADADAVALLLKKIAEFYEDQSRPGTAGFGRDVIANPATSYRRGNRSPQLPKVLENETIALTASR